MNLNRIILLTLLCFCSFIVSAQVSIKSIDSIYHLGKNLEYIITPENATNDVNEVINFQDRSVNNTAFFSKGISKNTFWLFFEIENQTNDSLFLLESENVDLNEIGLFRFKNGVVQDSCVISRNSAFSDMPIDFSYYAFPLRIAPNSSETYVIKVHSDWPISLPIHVGAERKMRRSMARFDMYMSFFAGVIVVFIILGFIVYFYDRSPAYLYYALYLIVYLVLQVAVMGYGHRLFWTESREINGVLNVVLTSSSAILLIQFVRKFFQTRRDSRFVDGIYVSLMIIFGINMVVMLSMNTPSVFSYVLNGAMIAFTLTSSVLGFQKLLKGFRPALYFSLGFVVFFIAIMLYAFSNLGILNYHPNYYYLTLIGSLFQFIMMGAALISRFRFFESERKRFIEQQQEQLKIEVDKQTKDISDKLIVIDRQKREKEVMLKEIHHRVKNNFQIINSLLRLQSYEITDHASKKVFEDAQQRIISMAMVHEKMYGSNSLASINTKEYILSLANEIKNNYFDTNIHFKFNIDDFLIGIKSAVPLGLLINELVTNAIKHAFKDDSGSIEIKLKKNSEGFTLEITDDGVGFTGLTDSSGIGMELVEAFVEQLDASMKRIDLDSGTKFEIKANILQLNNKEELETL